MDKRKKKTSVNQYTIYLKMLEDDEIFRTGILPDNYDVSYIHKKWKQLSDLLNLCPQGPQLTPDEWKKRLMDWKHTTRSKLRKSLMKSLNSNDRPKIQITALEKKAIDLWGPGPTENLPQQNNHQICIKTDPNQIIYRTNDPLKIQPKSEYIIKPISSHRVSNYEEEQEHDYIEPRNNKRIKVMNEVVIPDKEEDPIELYVEEENEKELNDNNDFNNTNDKNRKRNTITEIENQSISIIDINNIGHQLKRLADIKEEKLKFEIAKFKFKNPGFNYDI